MSLRNYCLPQSCKMSSELSELKEDSLWRRWQIQRKRQCKSLEARNCQKTRLSKPPWLQFNIWLATTEISVNFRVLNRIPSTKEDPSGREKPWLYELKVKGAERAGIWQHSTGSLPSEDAKKEDLSDRSEVAYPPRVRFLDLDAHLSVWSRWTESIP